LGHNARRVIQGNRGSTARTLAALESLLSTASNPDSVAR